jgi:hypothetical protein
MRWEDAGLVRQVQDALVQRAVEEASESVGVEPGPRRGQKVRAAHVADEERVPGKDPIRDVVIGVLEDQHAYGLRRMTGRGPNLEGDLPQPDPLAVDQWIDLEFDVGGLTKGDDRSCLLGQFEMTGQEVCMQVSLDHPFYPEALGGCLVEVDAYVACGIDDDRPPGRLVADEIGRMRKSAQIMLAEDHRPRPVRLI